MSVAFKKFPKTVEDKVTGNFYRKLLKKVKSKKKCGTGEIN